jgi:hypothetical protein
MSTNSSEYWAQLDEMKGNGKYYTTRTSQLVSFSMKKCGVRRAAYVAISGRQKKN